MTVKIFDSLETEISISKLIEKNDNYNFTDTGTITIDNSYTGLNYPILIITTNDTLTIDGVFLTQNGSNLSFDVSKNLGTSDTLVLDFDKQIYELNGNSIIEDMTIDDLIKLEENSVNNIDVQCTGDVDIQVDYKGYDTNNELHYVEDWSLTADKSYKEKESYTSNKKQGKILNEETYNFSIGKMNTDWQLFNDFESDNTFRIKYYNYVPTTNETETKYLIGVRFDQFKKSFSMGEFVINDIQGEAQNLL